MINSAKSGNERDDGPGFRLAPSGLRIQFSNSRHSFAISPHILREFFLEISLPSFKGRRECRAPMRLQPQINQQIDPP
jgi:hypothetical protein